MGHLRVKTSECAYKERDRRMKEQILYGINYDNIITEFIRELTVIKDQ